MRGNVFGTMPAGAVALVAALLPRIAVCQSADARIDYDLGIAADRSGDAVAAEAAFKRACLAEEGIAEACLAWADAIAKRADSDPDRDRDLKRAYGSAIMLSPEDTAARYALALLLIEKGDWVWAIEHLEAALASAGSPAETALVSYYLGYAKMENGDLDEAAKSLARAQEGLPADLAQRCRFYRATVAEKLGLADEAKRLFHEAELGPSGEIAQAVRERRIATTAFPRADGVRGQVTASLGMNTHPTAAVFDDPGSAGAPVLQSIFRGDLVYGAGNYTHGFLGALTLYRDQSWTEIGPTTSGARDDRFYVANGTDPSDSNLTHFQAQLSYAWRGFGKRLEHELRLGVDVELQFLDREVVLEDVAPDSPLSEDDCAVGSYEAKDDRFALYAYSIGERAWWSFAESKAAAWSLQLKHEVRPNALDENRSANRFRLRIQHVRSFLDKALTLKAYAGGRYDRTYHDDAVVKYDKLQPEASAELKWNTPLPYLAVLVAGKVSYHWYMNSRGNSENSFRPAYVSNPDYSAAENDAFEADYYDLARRDFEWELSAELQFDLWKRGEIAVRYVHHERLSNIDDAPRPMIESGGCGGATYQRMYAGRLGYDQDIAALELRQSF